MQTERQIDFRLTGCFIMWNLILLHPFAWKVIWIPVAIDILVVIYIDMLNRVR